MSARQSAAVDKALSQDLLTTAEVLASATNVPRLRGVYFLIKEGKIVYIGKSPMFPRRLGEHLKTKQIDAYYLLPFDGTDAELALLERRYIHRLQPFLNKHRRFWELIDRQTPSGITDRVARALAIVAAGETPYAAAKKTGIALSTIYRAIYRQKPTARSHKAV
jgi:hypothetical protein